ncbi:hypothetical protein [uncultured Lentibacter sp.]|uniref:DUF6902 family protein n=1 Tax=uncultured Lentibacter sp. TaxID=1659309 RepID=UPI00262293D8|nr:hypothetical protein [uncultured Lentibacter sp.]
MGTVIQFDFAKPVVSHDSQQTALAQCFAHHRRIGDDVFWLKENAEFLSIHATAGQKLGAQALSAYEAFYEDVENRLRFFPQYYRFLLSITLDLEALGFEGETGAALCAFAHEARLVDAELSDLQRAEAARLLARGGIGTPDLEGALGARLRRFISHSATFSLPNKKAAYELTHIVFYLSEYGRRDPEIGADAVRSLMFAGTLALIDENADLLAEVCLALRAARQPVPQAWEAWVRAVGLGFEVQPQASAPIDDYHEYLTCNWLAMVSGEASFVQVLTPERMIFRKSHGHHGVLRAVSEHLYQLADRRHEDWQAMRRDLEGRLAQGAYAHLLSAEAAYPEFDRFFAHFARARG